MRFWVFFLFLLMVPMTAWAQNKIIIINRDGTTEEFTLPDSEVVPDAEEIKKQREEQQKKEPPAKPKPLPTAEELMEESEPKKPEPKIEKKKKFVPPKAKPKAKPKPKTTKKQKPKPEKRRVYVPIPDRKPTAVERARYIEDSKPVFNFVDPKNIPSGTVITRDLAVRVALEVAPPSRGFDVYQTNYEGRPAFQVRFKTDNGPHDVVVDAETGKVLKK